jgi:hypothetical protein
MSNHIFDIFGQFEQISVELRPFVNVVQMGTAKAILEGVSAILP